MYIPNLHLSANEIGSVYPMELQAMHVVSTFSDDMEWAVVPEDANYINFYPSAEENDEKRGLMTATW